MQADSVMATAVTLARDLSHVRSTYSTPTLGMTSWRSSRCCCATPWTCSTSTPACDRVVNRAEALRGLHRRTQALAQTTHALTATAASLTGPDSTVTERLERAAALLDEAVDALARLRRLP